MAELPSSEALDRARDLIDDCLRQHADYAGPYHLDDDDEPTTLVEGALLTEWVLCSAWVDPATGETHYVRMCSPNLPAHHRRGLLAIWAHD